MASSPAMKNCGRMRERESKSLAGCHGRHNTFLTTVCCILITILVAGVSLSTHSAAASSSSNASSGGYECTFYVRNGIGYGVILSPVGNTSSTHGSDVKFTFTYNDSISDVASRLSIYSYSDRLYVAELKRSLVLVPEYRGGNPAYYAVKAGGIDMCRMFVQESTVAPSGDEYRKVTVSTSDYGGWGSGYYVGQGATVAIISGTEGGGGNSGRVVNGWELSQVGNVAVTVAITISSLIPFFIMLPDAAKTLSDDIAARRGRRSIGGDLYLSIFSLFIPLLCVCVAVISTTAMLNLLHQPVV